MTPLSLFFPKHAHLQSGRFLRSPRDKLSLINSPQQRDLHMGRKIWNMPTLPTSKAGEGREPGLHCSLIHSWRTRWGPQPADTSVSLHTESTCVQEKTDLGPEGVVHLLDGHVLPCIRAWIRAPRPHLQGEMMKKGCCCLCLSLPSQSLSYQATFFFFKADTPGRGKT